MKENKMSGYVTATSATSTQSSAASSAGIRAEWSPHPTLPYNVAVDREAYSKAMGKQIRGIMRKYEGSEPVCRRYRQLAAVLGYPQWKVEYYPSGVMELIIGDVKIYVRNDEYEVRIETGFCRSRKARGVKEYLERVV